jgi:hypothetical protein
MQNPTEGMRVCPTRVDGEEALMARSINGDECQRKQREHFHKCPTCTHYNARATTAPAWSARVDEAGEAKPPPA